MLEKLISGGQTGADQAGLLSASEHQIPTGGHTPKGYKTQKGSECWLKDFGLVEDDSSTYPPRTEKNVINSDGTLRFAIDFDTMGEKCTLRFIRKHRKPYLDIDLLDPPKVEMVTKWIQDNQIKVLNVAGNSNKHNPHMYRWAKKYLDQVFDHLPKGEYNGRWDSNRKL